MTTLVLDRIGSLVTNDPELGSGPLGLISDASVVIEDGVVIAVGRAGAIADERIDAEGACVLPGFVDSHTHLVFAGDRAAEFSARMAGQPYDGGGIVVTTEATRFFNYNFNQGQYGTAAFTPAVVKLVPRTMAAESAPL